MKKAKFAATAVAILAVIGGALAYKANSQARTFYKLGTTVATATTSACVVPTQLFLVPNANGFETQVSSAINTAPTLKCTAIVIENL